MSQLSHSAFMSALAGANERVVQLPHPSITFLAQNWDGRAALVARVLLEPGHVVPDGRGFSVSTNRSGTDGFVRIVSSEPGISPLFLKLVDYVMERTANGPDGLSTAESLVGAIDEFRRFTLRKPGRLSEQRIRGLVAELVYLRHLCLRTPSRAWEAFSAWGGPFDALHDFQFADGRSVEIKSTRRPPSEVRITSPAQLKPLPDGLDLLVLPLERVPPGGVADVRLVDLVAEIDSIAESSGGDVVEFWLAALQALGFDRQDEFYSQWSFSAGDWLRFAVTEGFPSISEADVPEGVVRVAFSIRLDALGEFSAEFADLEVLR